MQETDAALFHKAQRILEMRFSLGRETGNQVRAEGHVRPRVAQALRQRNRLIARMTPLHALEDQVIAVLQREMHVGRQTHIRQCLDKRVVNLDRVDGGNAQLRQIRYQFQDTLHQIAQLRRARQVCAPARQIDTGQHDLMMARLHEPAHLRHDLSRRHRA